MKTSSLVIAALTNNASSVKIGRPFSNEMLGSSEMLEYRPYTNGDTPWYKTSPKEAALPDYPINYVVPDYGVDYDITATKNSQAQSEKTLGRKLQATFEKPKSHPMDYFVPDFGVDADIKTANKNLQDSEQLAGKKFTAATQSDIPSYPVNYKVPDYGRDKDIIATEMHASLAEKQLGHVWANTKAIEDAKILRNYPMPDLGVDADILTTNANLKKAEQTLGAWNPELTQSAEDLRMELPISIAQMMRRTNQVYHSYDGHTLAQNRLRDDEICPSSGCPENPIKAAEEAKIIQYRANVPLDPEIGDTISAEKYAAKYHGELSAFENVGRFGKYVPSNYAQRYNLVQGQPSPSPTDYGYNYKVMNDITNTHNDLWWAEQNADIAKQTAVDAWRNGWTANTGPELPYTM